MRAFRAHLLRDLTAAALAAGLLLQSAQAVAPEWWSTRGVLAAGRPADDYAAANAGQLKHLAKKAAAEMNAVLPGGAGTEISTLIAAWSAAPAPEVTRDDYAAVSVGQLKRVAKPFYDRLGLAYPWGTGLTPDDFAVANAGQLKRVFSFLVPDAATLGLTDTDGDGFSDVLEFTEGTNPYLASSKPAGGGDVPSDGSNPVNSPGGNPGGGSQPSWTPEQLAAAEASYEVGLQERSVGLGTEIEEIGGDPDDSTGETVEKTYRVYPAWDEEPVWVAGPYSKTVHGSNSVPLEELANGATIVHDAVGGYSLPDWEDPEVDYGTLQTGGAAEATAFTWQGVAVSRKEYRLVRRLREGVTAPLDANGVPIKPEVKRSFLKVTTILPEPSGGAPTAEVVTFTIPAGADIATATTGVLFPPVTTDGTHRIELLQVDLAADADRDGVIATAETASQAQPFRFWINNDSDTGETDKEEEGSVPDYQDDYFTNIRDLEDFQMLKAIIPYSLFTKMLNSEAQVGLKWKGVSEGAPSVKVYRVSNEIDETKDYIWNKSKATSQAGGQPYTHSIVTVSGSETVWLPPTALQYYATPSMHPYLLFEGAAKGTGQLCLVFKLGSGGGRDRRPRRLVQAHGCAGNVCQRPGHPGHALPEPARLRSRAAASADDKLSALLLGSQGTIPKTPG